MENNIKSSSKGCSKCLINALLIGIAIGYGKACYNGLTKPNTHSKIEKTEKTTSYRNNGDFILRTIINDTWTKLPIHINDTTSLVACELNKDAFVYKLEFNEYVDNSTIDFCQFDEKIKQIDLYRKDDIITLCDKTNRDICITCLFKRNGGTHNILIKTKELQQDNSTQYYDYVMSEDDKNNLNNSLSSGVTPYKCNELHGKGAAITVRTSTSSNCDVVVIVKKNDVMVRNTYLHAGGSCTYNLPNGTYQVFFYGGSGWNPNKVMPNGQTGGFVANESHSKDDPVTLNYQSVEYELIPQPNGNFNTKQSNADEMF